VVAHPPMFPCVETIKRILQHVDEDHGVIRGHAREVLTSFTIVDISTYYKLPEREEAFNNIQLLAFNDSTKDILKSWWQEPTKFSFRENQVYNTEGLWKVYQLMATMMNVWKRKY